MKIERKRIRALITELETGKSCQRKSAELLNDLIESLKPNNVISFDIPRDITRYTEQAKVKCVDLANQALLSVSNNQQTIFYLQSILDVMNDQRRHIVNRAREELSHQQHGEVYAQLNSVVDGTLGASGGDLNARNWAEGLIMIAELEDMIDANA